MHPLEQLDVSTRIAKRAQYEAFEFEVRPRGVQVRNCSHEDPSAHEYLVTVHDGLPTACTCPADERFEGACKHRVAVAIRAPVIEAARVTQARADGGLTSSADVDSTAESDRHAGDEMPPDCACDELTDDFPCWPCVCAGRRSIPDE